MAQSARKSTVKLLINGANTRRQGGGIKPVRLLQQPGAHVIPDGITLGVHLQKHTGQLHQPVLRGSLRLRPSSLRRQTRHLAQGLPPRGPCRPHYENLHMPPRNSLAESPV